jgi:hypothetical protein
MGDRLRVANGLDGVAFVAGVQGQAERAVRLRGAAANLRAAIGAPLPLGSRAMYDQTKAALRAALGEDALAAAWAHGHALPLEQAIAEALKTDG